MKGSIDKKTVNFFGFMFLIILISLLVYDVLRQGIYSSKIGMNVAVVGDKSVSLMLLRPDEGLISWVDLPSNMKVKIYNSSATYPIDSLWKYGNTERRPFEILERSLGTSLGVAIARTIKVDGDAKIETVLGSLHKIGLKTDISFRDKWLIRNFVSDVVDSKKVIEEAVPKKAFDEVVEPDGKVFLSVNSVAELWTNSKFVLEPILSENVDVTVNNLTGQTGYGVAISKQVESAGMRVVEVKADKSDTVDGSGCIFYAPANSPVSAKFLIDNLFCHRLSATKEGRGKGIMIWLK